MQLVMDWNEEHQQIVSLMMMMVNRHSLLALVHDMYDHDEMVVA
jgi:cytochrome b561